MASNNYAEYAGLLLATVLLRVLGQQDATFRVDSQLLERQMLGRYQVKDPGQAAMRGLIRLEWDQHFERADIEHVYRHRNARADQLSKVAAALGTQNVTFSTEMGRLAQGLYVVPVGHMLRQLQQREPPQPRHPRKKKRHSHE